MSLNLTVEWENMNYEIYLLCRYLIMELPHS